MNKVILIGRTTSEIEIKSTQGGKSVCSFSLAVDRPMSKGTTDFIPCTAWNKTAELLGQYVRKGARIAVEGKLTSRQYEDKQGNKRTAYEVLVDSIEFLESREKAAEPVDLKQAFGDVATFDGDDSDLPF